MLAIMVNEQADTLLGSEIQGFIASSSSGPVLATPAAVAIGYAAVTAYAPAAAFTAGAWAVVATYIAGQAARPSTTPPHRAGTKGQQGRRFPVLPSKAFGLRNIDEA